MSGRYGYHRDELYFLQAGQHLAFGYLDQPPLTPLLARAALELFGDSLVGLRLASALTAGVVVLVTGLIAREFGGGRNSQVLAAGCIAVSAILLAVGHLLSTSTFDFLAWTALSWLVVRALRDSGRSWLAVGLVAGIALQNKSLVAFLLAGLAIGLLVAGPRAAMRNPWPWAAAAIALMLWAPNLVWQAVHGWPQLELSAAIAAGGSGTSEPWWSFLPFQLVLISPLLVPVWAAGLWRLARDPGLRTYRAFAVAYPLLAVVFMVTGGKPYYLAGLYPVLLAAGAEPTLRWARGGMSGIRRDVMLSGVVSAVLMLPLLPVQHLADTPIVAINYDAGETVGWPAFARTVAGVHAGLPTAERDSAIVFTRNYGQAGAVDRYGAELGLPPAYSGHNSYAEWGPPPETAAEPTIVIGYERDQLEQWFGSVEEAARIDNGVGLENDEQGTPVWVCGERLAPWARLWPQLRHLG
ncbi:MAG: glycosyltransferase family 39 protein [Nocardioidaceae bacterium]|nr:glycosyltransferase family 39 protein [Nocardioidaceae bacterium]